MSVPALDSSLVLAGFFRSGTSYRVRIALNLKGLRYRYEPVSLPKREHRSDAYLALNPQGLVPVLQTGGQTLAQSPAILEWLEESYPTPPLLPTSIEARARVRAYAAMIGCDIHPINNLRVLNRLREEFGANDTQVAAWCGHWISAGFSALETLLRNDSERRGFCVGAAPTLADCYLIPQVYSARRFSVELAAYPCITEIDARCHELPAFADAHPDRQPDAV